MAKKKNHKKSSNKSRQSRRSSNKDAQKMVLAGVGLVTILLLIFGGKNLHNSNNLSLERMKLKPTSTTSPTIIPTSKTASIQVNYAPTATPTPTHTPNPSIDSSFQPIKPYNLLYGQITGADCNGFSGFTFEVSNGGSPDILIMRDDGLGIGGPAKQSSPDVNEYYKISGDHRFTHELPGPSNGNKYKYHVYAEGAGSEFELVNSPIELTCP